MDFHHKSRWVFGPMIDGRHAAADYSITCEWPLVVDGFALAHCVMNAQQLRAAKADARLAVLSSLHAHDEIPHHVADHHQAHGARRGMKLPELLAVMSSHHHSFEPPF